jgi:polyhydroxybutyrate depolymerase
MNRPQIVAITLAALGLIGGALGWFVYAPMPTLSDENVTTRTLDVRGRTRSFVVYQAPERQPGQLGAPLLLVLHGSMMDGPAMRRMLGAGFEKLARAQGAVIVYPSGFEGHFNDGRLAATYSARTLEIDDVGFARAIVGTLAAERRIDPQRVYAFGYSNGGAMALRLAVEAPDLVAGVIVANANLPTPENRAWKEAQGRSAVVLIEGTKDPINPYDGGRVTIFGIGGRGTVLSAPDSARWFAQRAGLGAASASDTSSRMAGLDVQQQDWGAPARVRLVTLHGAGHTVAQSAYRFPRFLGATVRDDAILEAAWRLVEAR